MIKKTYIVILLNKKNRNINKIFLNFENLLEKKNNALVYISVIISIIIFIAVLVVIYLKCCKKERYVKIPSGDLSIGEKNIPFDDENEDGIN